MDDMVDSLRYAMGSIASREDLIGDWEKSNGPRWMFPYIGKQSYRKLVLFCMVGEKDAYWRIWAKDKNYLNGTTAEEGARYWCGLGIGSGNSVRNLNSSEKAMTAERLRVMFGNPFLFRPANYFLNLNTLGNGKVKRMALTIYDTEDWGLMPILADLVAESGLEDAEIDKHLRQVVCPHCDGEFKTIRYKLKSPNEKFSIDMLPEFVAEKVTECLFCNGTGKPMRIRGDWCIDLLSGQE